MRELNDSNPVELTEYAITAKIGNKPAFKWWIRPTLIRSDRTIKKVKFRYLDKTHKFGIVLPTTVAEALMIDLDTHTNFWARAIEKEMKTVFPAFELNNDDTLFAQAISTSFVI